MNVIFLTCIDFFEHWTKVVLIFICQNSELYIDFSNQCSIESKNFELAYKAELLNKGTFKLPWICTFKRKKDLL